MIRPIALVGTFLLLCPTVFSQKPEPDAQTMQALLSEVRQLRHDLQTAAFAARRAQIVIYRLHEEAVTVGRASERLENTRNALAQMQMQEEYQAEQIKRYEEYRDHAENEQRRKQLDDSLTQLREQIEAWTVSEQQLRTKESEQQADFRAEQAKQERLEDDLDRLDHDLALASAQVSNR